MVVANEDLLMEMQRVGALMRRSHHKKMHAHMMHGGPFGGAPQCGGPGMPPHGGPQGGPGMPPPFGGPGMPPHGGPHGGPGGPQGRPNAGPGMPPRGCKHKGSGKHGQMRILAMLSMQDGISQKDLAFLLGIRPQSLTLALEKLEDEGLIERKQDKDDKRTRRVYITKDGKKQAKSQAEERAKRADDVFAVLTDKEKDQLAAILAKLNAALEEQNSKKPAE